MFLKIRQLIYYQLKETVECRYDRWYRIKHASETVMLLTYTIRITVGMIIHRIDETFNLIFIMDPLCIYLVQSFRQLFRQYLMFCVLLALLGVLGKFTFYFSRVDTITFRTMYELVVHNMEQFQQCQRSKSEIKRIIEKKFHEDYKNILKLCFVPDILIRLFCRCKRLWQIYVKMNPEQIDPEKWMQIQPLKLQQSVVFDDRIEIIKVLRLINPIIIIFHMVLRKLIITHVISLISTFCLVFISLIVCYDIHRSIISKNKNFIIIVLQTFDLIITANNLFVVVQCGLFFVILSLIGGTFLKTRMNRLNNQLWRIAFSFRVRNGQFTTMKKSLRPLMDRTIHFLDWIYHQHGYACVDKLYSYQELWGNALFSYLIISVPFNVIAVSGLMVEQLTWGEKMVQYLITVVHAIMTIVSLLQLSRQATLLHKAKFNLIPVIQSTAIICKPPNNSDCMITKTLRLKLKYDDLFNRLTNGRKYGPYASTIGVVTNIFIFNVFRMIN